MTVKLLAAAFVVLLVYAHLADLQGDAYNRPLSMFRDYSPAWVGYAMFAILVAIGSITAVTAFRAQAYLQCGVYVFGTVLLTIVAATPSNSFNHLQISLLLMAIIFANFAARLWMNDEYFWFAIHAFAPTILALLTKLESFGIWQKALVVYFVLVVVIDQTMYSQWLARIQQRRAKEAEKAKEADEGLPAEWRSAR
jgi:hypothetical protein